MRILMAGSSGFLGTRLADRLRRSGDEVTRLVRRPARSADESPWNPAAGQLDPSTLTAADAVINLAGAGVADKRWTAAYKNELRTGRVDSSTTIAQGIAHLPQSDRPRVLLQASAVGWYGDTHDRPVTEEAPAGTGFLADLCRVWEAAARPAEDAGTRVVLLRTGLPLDAGGGLLKPQLLPFRLGLGAKLGGGGQWLPWISMEDWLRAVVFLLDAEEINGPVNVVGPEQVTNAQFTAALGRVLNRPAFLMVPGLALRIGLGEVADEMMKSQRVVPGVLERALFSWVHTNVESALRAAVQPTGSAA